MSICSNFSWSRPASSRRCSGSAQESAQASAGRCRVSSMSCCSGAAQSPRPLSTSQLITLQSRVTSSIVFAIPRRSQRQTSPVIHLTTARECLTLMMRLLRTGAAQDDAKQGIADQEGALFKMSLVKNFMLKDSLRKSLLQLQPAKLPRIQTAAQMTPIPPDA